MQKASEEAELQQLQDRASFHQELAEQKNMESKLRDEAERRAGALVMSSDNSELGDQVENLTKENARQKEELHK